jgi:hypothetical protein
MALAYQIQHWVAEAFLIVTVIAEALAFAHCVTRRADAFPVVGRLTKGSWVLMTLGALIFTLLTSVSFLYGGGVITSILAVIAITVALVYLLDVRPAIREATEGRGNW